MLIVVRHSPWKEPSSPAASIAAAVSVSPSEAMSARMVRIAVVPVKLICSLDGWDRLDILQQSVDGAIPGSRYLQGRNLFGRNSCFVLKFG